MMKKPKTVTTCLIVTATIAVTFTASAQKLPSEQKVSVYAPANIKIDGKGNEWTGMYQAKNNATMLTYVMSNDEDNLYLTVLADKSEAIGKIFHGGISLLIKGPKGNKTKPVQITYPLVSLTERNDIVIPLRNKEINTDSAIIFVNQAIGKAAKKIAIEGIADITEPDLSIYNDLGINAAVQADAARAMVFEYKVPIRYIKLLMDDSSSFEYNIIVNGAKIEPGAVVVSAVPRGGGGSLTSITIAPTGSDLFSPTDLKGTYTLAKKQ